MALNRYVVTADTTVPAGTAAPVSGGAGNTVSWSGPAGAWAEGFGVTFARGQVIVADPAGPLYAAITAAGGTLRAFTDTDATRAGASN